jgi:hypothetical protein
MTTMKQKCPNVHHGGVHLVDVVCGLLVDVVSGVNRLGDEGMCEILMI